MAYEFNKREFLQITNKKECNSIIANSIIKQVTHSEYLGVNMYWWKAGMEWTYPYYYWARQVNAFLRTPKLLSVLSSY